MAQLSAYSGASGDIFNHAQPNQVKRSKFDLSRITNFTADSGMIIPFDWFETLPGDSFELSAEIGLETLPTITNVLTPYRVRTHWYYLRNSDLWAGWNTFITKGRSGNVNLKIPQVDPSVLIDNSDSDEKICFDLPHSLSSYLGCLPSHQVPSTFSDYYSAFSTDGDSYLSLYEGSKVSALPFMAYQNICKYNYVNQNLLQDNHALFPVEGDSDWRLPYSIQNASTTNLCNVVSGKYFSDVFNISTEDSIFSFSGVYRSVDTEVSLLNLRYAQFDDDYFTSAMPWLQRGQVNTMDFDISDFELGFDDSTFPAIDSSGKTIYWGNDGTAFVETGSGEGSAPNGNIEISGYSLNSLLSYSSSFSSSITANQLRQLLALSVWQERNARVNGSYNSMIWIHWNHNPKTEEHMPIFIGGSSSYVDFSQVLQTSQSTTGSDGSPLGSSSGRGTMYDRSSIGRFQCPDYGIIMGIMIISPMTTYNTSLEHSLICENVMEDFCMPEFENLSPQPIIKRELFTSGRDSVDNSLFGYQERYSYLKSRVNVNRGLFRLPSESDTLFSASTQSRDIKSSPDLSYQFVVQSPANTRRDWLAYPSEPMFKVQVASKVSAVRPLSYVAQPNTFGF